MLVYTNVVTPQEHDATIAGSFYLRTTGRRVVYELVLWGTYTKRHDATHDSQSCNNMEAATASTKLRNEAV
jgi:hypothetical protein